MFVLPPKIFKSFQRNKRYYLDLHKLFFKYVLHFEF